MGSLSGNEASSEWEEERQKSRAHEQVISTVDEEVFVAVRQRGRMCTEKGLSLACEGRRDKEIPKE